LMGKDYLREKSAEKRGSNSINGRVVRWLTYFRHFDEVLMN
jgi:hypothetical protein